jgi:adenylate dimethylallyltransferase
MRMPSTVHVHAIVGPTGCGKSAAAEPLARRFGSPIVVADRFQCFIDLEVTSARTPRDQEKGIARHYVADRRVPDGSLAPRAAFESLVYLIGRLSVRHRVLIVEGGSISLMSELCRSRDLPFELSVEVMTMGDRDAHRQRLAARARRMLCPPPGVPGMLEELARAWRYGEQRPFVASVNGPEAIVRWCEEHGTAPADLAGRELPPGVLGEIVDAVTDAHLEHGDDQEAAFAAMFGTADAPVYPAAIPARFAPGLPRADVVPRHGSDAPASRPAVTVFCGARPGTSPVYLSAASDLGRRLAGAGFDLVYGGASLGLMGAVADAVLESGGAVTGVIPRGMTDSGIEHRGLTTLHVVESMHERKALMARLADAFVALPGGLGTAEELLEILTWRQLGLHDRPCLLLDVDSFWTTMLEPLRNMLEAGFIEKSELAGIAVCPEPADLVASLAGMFAGKEAAIVPAGERAGGCSPKGWSWQRRIIGTSKGSASG